MRFLKMFLFLLCLVFHGVSVFAAKRALLVGISEYKQGTYWSKLHAANDVRLVKEQLVKRGYDVQTLTDSKATFRNITHALDNLLKKTGKGDIIYILLSGHGQPFEDLNGDEGEWGWDFSYVAYDAYMHYDDHYKGENHLLDDKIGEYIDALRKKAGQEGVVYVTVDACYSGGASKGESDEEDIEEHEIVIQQGEDTLIDELAISEDNEEEPGYRGNGYGFSTHGKIYNKNKDVMLRSRIPIKQVDGLAKAVVLESCMANEPCRELVIRITGPNGEVRKFYGGALSYTLYTMLKNSNTILTKNTEWVKDVENCYTEMLPGYYRQTLVIESTEIPR